MTDHILLSYYLQELSELRNTGKRFARENPQLAYQLQLDQGFEQNPQLAQLIESLVFMNARVSYQFEEEYPRLVRSLIDLMYPHFSIPIPSMAIIQWPVAKKLEKSFTVPRGTLVETEPSDINSARFSTAYNIKIHPIDITEAKLLDNFESTTNKTYDAKSIIYLRIESSNPKVALSSLELSDLQFFISGEQKISYLLYEVLLTQCDAISFIEKNNNDKKTHWLSKNDLCPMGFSLDEALLPQDPRTLSAHRLLTEFFSFPQKFLFFKLANLPKIDVTSNAIEIYFYLRNKPEKALFQINSDNFQLGCTPIVNLFSKTVEPIEIQHQQYEYPVITDLRRPQDYEIYQIQNVTGLYKDERIEIFNQLFSSKDKSGYYWHTQRVPCSQINGNTLNGTELMMTVIQNSPVEESIVLVINTLCTNRDLTTSLSQQVSLPALQTVQGNIPPSKIDWIVQLTPPRPALFQGGNYFLLLQSLSSSLFGFTSDKAQQLKNLLETHVQIHQKDFKVLIDSIIDLKCERSSAFVHKDNFYGYCNGVKLILQLNKRPSENLSSWAFFNVLEKFFIDLSPINSFIQLCVLSQDGELYQWPIRAGELTPL